VSTLTALLEQFSTETLDRAARRALATGLTAQLLDRLDSSTAALAALDRTGYRVSADFVATVSARLQSINGAVELYKRDMNASTADALKVEVDAFAALAQFETLRASSFLVNQLTPVMEEQTKLERRIRDAEREVKATREDAASAITHHANSFKTAVDSLRDQTEKLVNTYGANCNNQITEFERIGDNLRTQWNAHIEKAQSLVTDLEKRLNLIQNGVASSAYQVAAESERKQADRLRGIALTTMLAVALGVIVLTVVGLRSEDGLNSVEALARYLLVLILFVPAGYASRESAKHRARSDEFLLRGMGILAVQNYIQGMPDAEALEIKKVLAIGYLGVVPTIQPGPDSFRTGDFQSILKIIRPSSEDSRELQAKKEAASSN
jgi:hypothetical protein